MRYIEIESARLMIKTQTIEEMLGWQKNEQNEETKREYQDMIDWMTGIPGHEEWALLEHDVSCVQAQTEDNNEISKKVLMKNGFQEVGRGEEGPLFEKKRRLSEK